MADPKDAIKALSQSNVRLVPSERAKSGAMVTDYDAWYASWKDDPDGFWNSAADELHWFERWTTTKRIDAGKHEWFIGGKTNLSYNCLERNIERGLGDKVALYAESEKGPSKTFSYREVLCEVSKIAHALRAVGVDRGDRVIIYMPLGPEGLFTMQACVRIGAIHSVVYAGMGSESLRHRIEDSGAKVVVCSDVTYRRGKVIPLKPIVDTAVADLNFVQHILVQRRETDTTLGPRESDFAELVAAQSEHCDAEHMDAEDIAFVLYTSGTTGKPKGVVHVHGGYAVGVHLLMRNYFDTREDDVWWSTSDIGWIVGHSYICYGPMMTGASQVIREGTPDYPTGGITWELIDRYKVTTMFTAPTAIRMFMRMGEESLAEHDRSSLRVLYCAGEPFNPEAWVWAQDHICSDGGFVADNYWQTEIASPMLGTFPVMDGRPGFVGKPMPGIELEVVDDEGKPRSRGEGGLLIMKYPVPYMMRTIYGDDARYQSYWSEKLGGYVTGDIAVCDREGYWAVLGRSDDVLNVAGHRIGTADVESALITHPAVVESAVIGLPDEIKGERIKAFVVSKDSDPDSVLATALIGHVREALGPIAQPSEIGFIDALPKTRSGKIMRRLLKARELGHEEGDTSTLED
jgi:acetyl-CoA synthetase